MEIHKRGGVDSSYDLYVDVPDEEDVILRILELLRGTSLVNIRINEENREDIHGILQISFKNAQDLERAEHLITANTDYTVLSNKEKIMSNIYDSANELSRGLRELPEYKAVKAAKDAISADAEASKNFLQNMLLSKRKFKD